MDTEQIDEDYEEDEEESDSDDDVGLLKPAFDLQALKIQEDAMRNKSKGPDLSGPPADGLEYLLQVRKEARSVPDVVVAKSIAFANTPTEIMTIPSKETRVLGEIQQKQLASFTLARKMMLDARSSQMTTGTLPFVVKSPSEEPEEDEKEEMEVEESPEEDPSASKTQHYMSISEKLAVDTKQPLITTMLGLDQDEISELLDEFADKVAELPKQPESMQIPALGWPLGRWIFSALAAVDEPASAENLAAMRNLANRCLETCRAYKQEQSLSSNNASAIESILVDLDLFLLIVASHFKQKDIVDILVSAQC